MRSEPGVSAASQPVAAVSGGGLIQLDDHAAQNFVGELQLTREFAADRRGRVKAHADVDSFELAGNFMGQATASHIFNVDNTATIVADGRGQTLNESIVDFFRQIRIDDVGGFILNHGKLNPFFPWTVTHTWVRGNHHGEPRHALSVKTVAL